MAESQLIQQRTDRPATALGLATDDADYPYTTQRTASLYDVLIEKTEAVYIARLLFWPREEIIAETREDVLAKARAVIQKHLSQSELVTITIDSEPMVASESHGKSKARHTGIGTRISQRFAAIGGVDLDIPARSMARPAPQFANKSP